MRINPTTADNRAYLASATAFALQGRYAQNIRRNYSRKRRMGI